jgi:hypothetical protein
MANARKTQKTCNWSSFAKASEGKDGKKCAPVFASLRRGTAWFVHYGCVPGLYPDSTFLLTASMPKPTQTTLYCRAVMRHALEILLNIWRLIKNTYLCR